MTQASTFANVLEYQKPSEEGKHAHEMHIFRAAGKSSSSPSCPAGLTSASQILPGGGGFLLRLDYGLIYTFLVGSEDKPSILFDRR